MTPTQLLALKNIVKTQEELQVVWDNPGKYKFGPAKKNFQALVVTCVVEETSGYKWMSAVRLVHWKKGRQRFKPTATWSGEQRREVQAILDDQLIGVGKELSSHVFDSSKAMHLEKPVTTEERNLILTPALLGNGANGHKPIIRDVAGAKRLLDNIEKELNDKQNDDNDRRIILPGEH